MGTEPARAPGGPASAHSSQRSGSQYASIVLTEHLALEEIAPSIGTVGDAYGNAPIGTTNGPYRAECVRTMAFQDGPHKTITDVEYATASWVDWCNHRRLHGSLGMVSPDEYERLSSESRSPHRSGREPVSVHLPASIPAASKPTLPPKPQTRVTTECAMIESTPPAWPPLNRGQTPPHRHRTNPRWSPHHLANPRPQRPDHQCCNRRNPT